MITVVNPKGIGGLLAPKIINLKYVIDISHESDILLIMKTTSKVIDGNLYEYDSKGNLIHTKGSNGSETFWEYDNNGNEIHSKYFDGHSYPYERFSYYDSNGKLNHFKDSNCCEYWYDSNGNKL